MEATLIGESSRMERMWTDHFRRTGTYHMLVIDGLHITMLAAFLLFAAAASAFCPKSPRWSLPRPVHGSTRWFPDGTRPPSAPPADSRCTLPRATSIAGAVC